MSEQYVSIDCPVGDITLTLDPDQTFDLSISYWDATAQAHSGEEALTGGWTKEGQTLKLTATDTNEVLYEQTLTAMGIGNNEVEVMTYAFKSNGRDFFATGFDLLERTSTDEFLLNATRH